MDESEYLLLVVLGAGRDLASAVAIRRVVAKRATLCRASSCWGSVVAPSRRAARSVKV